MECSVLNYVNPTHALFIAITIGTLATDEALYIILGIDFLMNMYACFKIIYLHRKFSSIAYKGSFNPAIETIRVLVLNEHVELIMGITYWICFMAAYCGQNGDKIGNIRLERWNFKRIPDIDMFCTNLSILFCIDTCSAILCSLLLYVICNINVFRAYYQMLQEFWLLIAVQTALLLEHVSVKNSNSKFF